MSRTSPPASSTGWVRGGAGVRGGGGLRARYAAPPSVTHASAGVGAALGCCCAGADCTAASCTVVPTTFADHAWCAARSAACTAARRSAAQAVQVEHRHQRLPSACTVSGLCHAAKQQQPHPAQPAAGAAAGTPSPPTPPKNPLHPPAVGKRSMLRPNSSRSVCRSSDSACCCCR